MLEYKQLLNVTMLMDPFIHTVKSFDNIRN